MSSLQSEQNNNMSGGDDVNGNAAGLELDPDEQAQLCAICLMPPVEPVETKCGHTYCIDCLDTLICTANCIACCPLCRREI